MPMLLPEGLHGARHNIQPTDFLSLLLAPRRLMDVPADFQRRYSSNVSLDGD
jgi:hypothetical protein